MRCGTPSVAGRKYEPVLHLPNRIELSRVVDRGIRESGCIDMESLCIVPGEKVWGVMIDIHVLSDQGNIFDACGLAAIALYELPWCPLSALTSVKTTPCR